MTRYEELRNFVETVAPMASAKRCVEWWGGTQVGQSKQPYGGLKINGKTYRANRVSFAIAHGVSPDSDEMPEVVAHRCDNPPCVLPAHLFGTDNAGNVTDAVVKGRRPRPGEWQSVYGRPFRASEMRPRRGEENNLSKLTDEDVRAMRKQREVSGTTFRELGEQFGVSTSAAHYACRGDTWAHIV